MARAVDLTDLDLWARGVPYAEFARLRRDAPVTWRPEVPPGSGFWSVHRYDDIVTASRDVTAYSSARGISFEEPTDEDMAARRTIIDTDPPDHARLRKIVSGCFTQRAVAMYREFVERLTERVRHVGLGCMRHGRPSSENVRIQIIGSVAAPPSAGKSQFQRCVSTV